MPETQASQQLSPLMEKLLHEKNIAREFQERRHEEWNDSYELYRNKVKTNRLTQRQAVSIPLMKETVKTLLTKVDEPPAVEWKELTGDEDKELVLQELWNDDVDRLNLEGIDVQDKKNVLMYGRSFKKLNWSNNELDVQALDIFDIVIDPIVKPLDIESARFLIHQNIFRSLREILVDKRYTAKGKAKLKIFATTERGIVQSGSNKEEMEKRQERLVSMGVDSDEFPLFAGGDVIVNLTEHYSQVWNKDKEDWERRVVVYADDETELLDEKLTDLIGVDFWPFVTWGEDVETDDFWSDGPADLVRTPNKVVNVWFSQLVENRTLRNFQMHWYDTTNSDYDPQTYEPGPGRMLPAPGNPRETIMPVDVQGLDETLTAVDFLIRVVERGTSATAIEKGVSEKKQITLGEVELLMGQALERTLAMAKFYRRAWKEFAMKWYQLMKANSNGKRTLYKMSRNGNIWPLVAYPYDWASASGYKAMVTSHADIEEEQTKDIQKMMFIMGQFPQNNALRKIGGKRMLKMGKFTPEEIREIQEEMQSTEQAVAAPPEDVEDTEGQIQTSLQELQNLNGQL